MLLRRRDRIGEHVRGFYAVLDRDDEALARALLASGARILQVRLKPRGQRVSTSVWIRVARMARRICNEVGAALIVNDRIDVALAVGADGAHLGQTDLSLADARASLAHVKNHDLWIGVSTHDEQQVRAAVLAGASYVGYGPVFGTSTKENPDPVQGLDALARAVAVAGNTPVVAIGGITASRSAAVYATGAAAICAISAVNEGPDVISRGRAFLRPGALSREA